MVDGGGLVIFTIYPWFHRDVWLYHDLVVTFTSFPLHTIPRFQDVWISHNPFPPLAARGGLKPPTRLRESKKGAPPAGPPIMVLAP